jgi:glucose 1-dehydrogenase
MKAVAVYPRKPDSIHLADLPEPKLDDIPDGKGVRVKLLRCGLDGTDKEIAAGEYGTAPEGFDFLVEGHENFGVVLETGPKVTRFKPGDYVVCRVRRAGSSIYDLLDMPDLTTDDEYFEHGISRVHGFLTERYVEDERYLILIPAGLRHVAVLLEPVSVIEKGITQAYEVQRRLKVWEPKRAAVLGAGTIGLLAAMGLRNRGLEVMVFGLDESPYLNSDLIEAIGATYVSTKETTLEKAAASNGRADLVFECTGFSPLVFDGARDLLGKNGVMVLSSVTGGSRTTEVPSDAFNLDMVLGNKVLVGTVNANRAHFESGVSDMALTEARWPGWLAKLITHRVDGLENYEQAFDALGQAGAIKVVVEIADE